MMLEAIQNNAKKYAIPSHLRDEVEDKKKMKKKRPSIVPKVFGSIWKHPDLLKSVPSVQVPDPTPMIDWSQVKFKPVLPKPEPFPVQSASQDPVIYNGDENNYSRTTDARFHVSKIPFGQMWGYETNLGIVPVPTTAIGGYVFNPDQSKWVIFASSRSSAFPSRRGRVGGGQGDRGRGERRKKLHYLP